MIMSLILSVAFFLPCPVGASVSSLNQAAKFTDQKAPDGTSQQTKPVKAKSEPGYWAGSDLEAAKKEALQRGVPILLVVIRDEDPVSTSWSKQHLKDKAFLNTLAKHGVPALACQPAKNKEIHSPIESETDTCPLAGCQHCDEHLGSDSLLENLTIPNLLPRIFSIEPISGEVRTIPEDIPFRGAKALENHLASQTENSPPSRIQYRFLLKHLQRAVEYDGYEDFEKGCQELVGAKRLLPLFGPEMTALWDQAYAPYRGRGIQMIRKAKAALKTDRTMGARLLTRVAKMMADLPEGERARHLLNALKPNEDKIDSEKDPSRNQNIPN